MADVNLLNRVSGQKQNKELWRNFVLNIYGASIGLLYPLATSTVPSGTGYTLMRETLNIQLWGILLQFYYSGKLTGSADRKELS